ncbi:MAG: carboxypeptidase-like regulatory domain-containing protein, partial [Bacteroidia bacterium]
MYKKQLLLLSLLLFAISANAQSYTQTIRGTIVDKQSQMPLQGANVVVLNSNPFKGCVSDEQGKFRLENVEVGRQQIKVSYLGYKEQVIPVLLTSAKEFIIHIQLEEAIIQGKEIVITGEADKSRALNEMSAVSTRSFQIDEANRYAGSRNDPARMASNYAGVVGGSDNRNDIIIRGNSPLGLLWRMENVDIPNPNHFAATGATGGAISILNNNVLANSDFMTGAFAAEYINALSGVFDLKIRNGNNEKREYTGQVGLNGFELGAEGPLNNKKQSCYLASYRYSAPAIMQRMGINLGTSGIPFYQDLTYKLHFPLKNGSLSLFGVGGKSHIDIKESNRNGEEMYAPENRDIYFGSAMAVSGASYTRFLNNTTYTKISLAGTFEQNNNKVDSLDKGRIPGRIWLDLSNRYKATLHALINKKYSSQLTVRSGIMSDYMSFNIENKRYYPNDSVRTILNSDGNTFLNRAYTQAAYKFSSKLTLNTGISFIHLALNNKFSIEPRAALSYEISGAQRLSVGYGKHSRMHDIMVYFIETNVNGVQTLT